MLTALRGGQHFMVLVKEEGIDGSQVIRDLLLRFGLDLRSFHAANPLVSPLTMDRILLQAGGQPGGTEDESIASLYDILTHDAGQETRVLLVIEDADTLTSDTLRCIRALPGAAVPGKAVPQVLFVGGPGMLERLKREGYEESPDCSIVRPVDAEADTVSNETVFTSMALVPISSRHTPAFTGEMELPSLFTRVSYRRRRMVLWAVATLVLVTFLALERADLSRGGNENTEPGARPFPTPAASPSRREGENPLMFPRRNANVPPTDAAPSAVSRSMPMETLSLPPKGSASTNSPASPSDEAAVSPLISLPSISGETADPGTLARDHLRRDFDLFLSRVRPDMARLSIEQRDTLFQDYLAHKNLTRESLGR